MFTPRKPPISRTDPVSRYVWEKIEELSEDIPFNRQQAPSAYQYDAQSARIQPPGFHAGDVHIQPGVYTKFSTQNIGIPRVYDVAVTKSGVISVRYPDNDVNPHKFPRNSSDLPSHREATFEVLSFVASKYKAQAVRPEVVAQSSSFPASHTEYVGKIQNFHEAMAANKMKARLSDGDLNHLKKIHNEYMQRAGRGGITPEEKKALEKAVNYIQHEEKLRTASEPAQEQRRAPGLRR